MKAAEMVRLAACWAAAIAIALCTATGTLLASPKPSLSVSQSAVVLAPDRSATVFLASEGLSGAGTVKVGASPDVATALHRDDATHWTLSITPRGQFARRSVITVQLLDRLGRRSAHTLVSVEQMPRPAATDVVDVSLILDGSAVVEGARSRGRLAVTNKSELPIHVSGIISVGSRGVEVGIEGAGAPIAPRATAIREFWIAVAPSGVPRAGVHQLAFKVSLAAKGNPGDGQGTAQAPNSPEWTGDVVVSREVTVAVPGVSEVQGVLQIPSLLILPGVLALVAFSAVFGLIHPARSGATDRRLSIAFSPSVWVVAITASFVLDLGYNLITGRNILYGIGIRDVAWLWMTSLALGLLAGTGAFVWKRRLMRVAAAPRFRDGLSPMEFLVRMAELGEPLRRRVRVEGEGMLFDLGADGAATSRWVCGAVDISFPGPRDDQLVAAFRADWNDAQRLIELIRSSASGAVALSWRSFFSAGLAVTAPVIVRDDPFTGGVGHEAVAQEAI